MDGRASIVRWSGRGLGLLLVALTVSVGLVGPAVGAGFGEVASPAHPSLQSQAATPTPSNDTVRHEDPNRVDRPGDLAGLRQWLAGRMAVELEACAVAVGGGTTDVCELGEDYPDWLRKYVDVADETGAEADDRRAQLYQRAANRTESLVERAREFRETRREYERARAAGNVTEARRLARELFQLETAIDEDAAALETAYAEFEQGDGVELDAAEASVNRIRANVSEVTSTVETALFVRTMLTAELAPRSISFLRPGTVSGRLRAENGTGIGNRSIQLRVGNRTMATTTDATGRFAVDYRPVTVPAAAERVEIRYLPRRASSYLGANTSVPVSISPVEPRVAVSLNATSAGYRQGITVSGRVRAGTVGVPEAPVVASVDGRRVGTVRTDDAGRFTISAVVGTTDGPGAVIVRASLLFDGRAVAAAGANTTLTVPATGTDLTIEPAAEGPAAVRVAGTLTTEAGRPVPNQPVTISLNATAIATVRTAPDGTFSATIDVPSDRRAPDQGTGVALEAVFTGAGTNLEGSRAQATVRLPAAERSRAGRGPLAVWQVLLIGLGVFGLALLLWRWEFLGDSVPAPRPGRPASQPGPVTGPESDGRSAPIGLLEAARARLEANADEAVILTYAAVRDSLADAVGPTGRAADTHWEFLAACRQDGLDDDAIAGLTALTQAYERAAFAPASVTRADATAAMSTGEQLLAT